MPWVTRDDYLTQSEMKNNMTLSRNYLHSIGWGDNAIAALGGNMQLESSISPGRKEIMPAGQTWTEDNGYGLCAWTPATKLFKWLTSKGYTSRTFGNYQLQYVNENSSQWGPSGNPNAPSSTPPITWDEFKTSTLPPSTLAAYFMYYWERPAYDPAVNRIDLRMKWADEWYTFITGEEPEPPEPDPDSKHRAIGIGYRRRKIGRRY